MINNRPRTLIFTCNGSPSFVRCLNLGLKISHCCLQHFGTWESFCDKIKLTAAFTYLCGFNHCAIGILNGDIGCYIDLCVICVLEVIKVCYSLRKEFDLGRKRRNRHNRQHHAQSQQNSQQFFWFCFFHIHLLLSTANAA